MRGVILVEVNLTPAKSNQTIAAKRIRQVRASIHHYFTELERLKTYQDVLEWIYYKVPQFFSLREFPSALSLEVTNECNFSCPHCPRNDLNKGRSIGFMDLGVFRKIAHESAGRVTVIKVFGLGEPALHPELDSMMHILRINKIRSVLYTNGTLFDLYEPQKILDWNLSVLVVSIDGTDKRSFDRLRLGGDYWSIRSKLSQFRKFRDLRGAKAPHIEIRHVIMPNETSEMLQAFRNDWSFDLGDSVKFNLLGPPYGSNRKEDPARPRCRDILREMHIRYDGRTPLCGYDGHREWIGDVRKSTLNQLWRSTRLEEVRTQHSRRDLSKLPFCKTCQFR